MDSTGNENYFKRTLDKLERDPLPPPLDAAEAEYFADMAFDDRLLNLLEMSPTSISIYAQHTTEAYEHGIARDYFNPNAQSLDQIFFEDGTLEYLEAPAFAYSIEGNIEHHTTHLNTNISVTPESGDDPAVKIESDPKNPDVFYISKQSNDLDTSHFDILRPEDVFTILCQLKGARKPSVDTVLSRLEEQGLNKPADMRRLIVELWEHIGEAHGKRITTRTLAHEVVQPANEAHPEKITLVREEIEEPSKTTIKLRLNHTTTIPESNVTDTYSLRLTFEQLSEVVEKDAERTVVSAPEESQLTSISAYRQQNGRTTKLDIDAITIKELFVDWFDQLVSA